MKPITLRNVPPEVEKAIRQKARRKRISANRAVIELLQERVGVVSEPKKNVHHDLDHLAGSWSWRDAAEFERTLEAARQIDEDLWR